MKTAPCVICSVAVIAAVIVSGPTRAATLQSGPLSIEVVQPAASGPYSPRFHRPEDGSNSGSCSLSPTGTGVAFLVVNLTLTNLDTSPLMVTLHYTMRGAASGGGTLADPFLVEYDPAFNPAQPCMNILAADDNGGNGSDARITESITLPASSSVGRVLVLTAASNSDAGTFTLDIEADGMLLSVPGELSAQPAAAPALSGFGLLLAVLLLAAGGAYQVRRGRLDSRNPAPQESGQTSVSFSSKPKLGAAVSLPSARET